jgi:Hypothetical protein PM1777
MSKGGKLNSFGLTKRMEAFCQAVLTEEDHSKAYRKAYPSSKKWQDNSVHIRASRMMSDAKIILRVAELKRRVEIKHEITVDSIVKELMEDKQFAMECKNASATVKTTELKAKLAGLFTEKVEHSGKMELMQYKAQLEADADDIIRSL